MVSTNCETFFWFVMNVLSYLNRRFLRCEHYRSIDCLHCFSNLCRNYLDPFITYKLRFRKKMIRFIPVLRQRRIYPREYEYFMRDNYDLANYQANVVVAIYAFNEFYFCQKKNYKIFLSQHLFENIPNENIPNEIDFGECLCCWDTINHPEKQFRVSHRCVGYLNRHYLRCNHKSRHCLLCFKHFPGFFKCLYTTMENLAIRKEISKKKKKFNLNFPGWWKNDW